MGSKWRPFELYGAWLVGEYDGDRVVGYYRGGKARRRDSKFSTRDAAQKKADKLNAEDRPNG